MNWIYCLLLIVFILLVIRLVTPFLKRESIYIFGLSYIFAELALWQQWLHFIKCHIAVTDVRNRQLNALVAKWSKENKKETPVTEQSLLTVLGEMTSELEIQNLKTEEKKREEMLKTSELLLINYTNKYFNSFNDQETRFAEIFLYASDSLIQFYEEKLKPLTRDLSESISEISIKPIYSIDDLKKIQEKVKQYETLIFEVAAMARAELENAWFYKSIQLLTSSVDTLVEKVKSTLR